MQVSRAKWRSDSLGQNVCPKRVNMSADFLIRVALRSKTCIFIFQSLPLLCTVILSHQKCVSLGKKFLSSQGVSLQILETLLFPKEVSLYDFTDISSIYPPPRIPVTNEVSFSLGFPILNMGSSKVSLFFRVPNTEVQCIRVRRSRICKLSSHWGSLAQHHTSKK